MFAYFYKVRQVLCETMDFQCPDIFSSFRYGWLSAKIINNRRAQECDRARIFESRA